jgi:signal transduction histidine kinase/CheY-like chemotaxis protein
MLRDAVANSSFGVVARHALAAAAWLLAAAAVASTTADTTGAAPWFEADFLFADDKRPPSDAAPWSRQALPDEWQRTRPHASGVAWYRFHVSLSELPREVQAVYVPRGGDQLGVFVNGRLIGSTAEEGGDAMNTWKRPLLFTVPPAMLASGENLIHVRLEGRAEHYSGLSPVIFGSQGALRDIYWKRFALQTIGPVGLAAALGLLGIFFLILWSRRRDDATYVLFGAASIVWAARNVADVVFHLAIPQPHWEIAMAQLYFVFVGLLCLFCLRFVDATLPRYERLLRWSMLIPPFLLYAALPWVGVLTSTRMLLLYMLALVVPPLAVVARAALFQRSLGAILIALAGFVAFGFGIYDWIAVGRPGMFDSIRLVPYAALFFTTAIGWLLAHRFLLAYQGLERLNEELDARVMRKSAELTRNMEKLQEAKLEAEAANAAKSRFLAAASHDLRQPLHALGLFAAELSGRDRSPGNQELAGRIGQSVQALEMMFSELLDLSRLDAGAVRVELRDFPVQEIFDRMAVDFLPLAREKGLQLRIRSTKHWCESDPIVLERILRNLVSNAIRYTHRGGVLVACRQRGKRLWLEVRDTGIGITDAEREHVFEEYYQVANQERDRSKGLGLGLAIVKRLAGLLGERLLVKSAPGRGSLFAVRTRRVPAAELAPARDARWPGVAGERWLVALIEDDRLVRWAMEGLLASHGLIIAAGADFVETKAALLGHGRAPDLVIADYRLRGGETGVAAARCLREEYAADIPVLLLTGESSPDRLAGADAQGFPVLRKPATPEQLLAAIASLLPAVGKLGQAQLRVVK